MLRGLKKNGDQAIDRSRGGLSTKIHACCDALGQAVRCFISGGQEANITHAQALIEGIQTQALLADKGYDANELLQALAVREIEAVIPPRKIGLSSENMTGRPTSIATLWKGCSTGSSSSGMWLRAMTNWPGISLACSAWLVGSAKLMGDC
jgi:transposase